MRSGITVAVPESGFPGTLWLLCDVTLVEELEPDRWRRRAAFPLAEES